VLIAAASPHAQTASSQVSIRAQVGDIVATLRTASLDQDAPSRDVFALQRLEALGPTAIDMAAPRC